MIYMLGVLCFSFGFCCISILLLITNYFEKIALEYYCRSEDARWSIQERASDPEFKVTVPQWVLSTILLLRCRVIPQFRCTVSASRVPYRSYVHNWPVRLVPDSEVPDSEARGYLAGHCAVQRRR